MNAIRLKLDDKNQRRLVNRIIEVYNKHQGTNIVFKEGKITGGNIDDLMHMTDLLSRRDIDAQLFENDSLLRGSLSYLLEGEMERAQAVLATESMTDAIQRIIKDIAKIQNEQMLDLYPVISKEYSQELADNMQEILDSSLPQVIEQLKNIREQINQHTIRMEQALSNVGNLNIPNDMSQEPDPKEIEQDEDEDQFDFSDLNVDDNEKEDKKEQSPKEEQEDMPNEIDRTRRDGSGDEDFLSEKKGMNNFLLAQKKAIERGDTVFVFDGREYPVLGDYNE